jgi:uncharacterized protein
VNEYTGLGTGRDKATLAWYQASPALAEDELRALFYSNPIAARIVQTQPREMLRRGYDVSVQDDSTADVKDALTKEEKRLAVNTSCRDAMIWGRLFGGSVIIIGAVDGRTPDQPLDEGNIQRIDFLNVVDARYVRPKSYYEDPLAPKLGEVRLYSIGGKTGKQIDIHESRVIRFEGPLTDPTERRYLKGWTYSALQRPYDHLRSFGTTFQAVAHLVQDASQAVYKIKNLYDMVATDEEDRLHTRMELLDAQRSVARAIILDTEEDFGRQATSFSGLPETLDRFMQLLSAACEMPVTILMGRSPAGQNATGDADFRAFYDTIASEQENVLTPILLRLYRLIMLAKSGPTSGKAHDITIAHRPLLQMNEIEQAQLEKTTAEKDALYLDRGVYLEEEIALARSGNGGKFSALTPIDTKAREASLKMSLASLEEGNASAEDPQTPDPSGQPGVAKGAVPKAPSKSKG